MKKLQDWREALTENESAQFIRLDEKINKQTKAVALHPDNIDLLATLTLLKHKRYLLQNAAAARIKRRLMGIRPRQAA